MADRVCARLPEKIDTYYEPMIGGGAVFIRLAREGRFRKAIIGDVNAELVGAWTVVRDDVDALVRELRRPAYVYSRDAFLAMRDRAPASMSPPEAAARFIYLNRTCFNGLYRVNRLGEFNVPFGKYKDPVICDEPNLRTVSSLLKGVKIVRGDFARCVAKARPGDAAYFDPPYVPVSDTSSFTAYTADGFGLDDHKRLAETFGELGRRGVRAVLSNSVAKEALALYKPFDRDTVQGSRSIGGPAEYRGSAGEIIIWTGPLTAEAEQARA